MLGSCLKQVHNFVIILESILNPLGVLLLIKLPNDDLKNIFRALGSNGKTWERIKERERHVKQTRERDEANHGVSPKREWRNEEETRWWSYTQEKVARRNL